MDPNRALYVKKLEKLIGEPCICFREKGSDGCPIHDEQALYEALTEFRNNAEKLVAQVEGLEAANDDLRGEIADLTREIEALG